jgi:hypothetical protein
MAALDVQVLASFAGEGTPQVIPQAFAMKTPVVATKIASIPDLLGQGERGILIEPENALSLAEGVLKLIRNHGFWLEVTTLIVPDENDSDSSLKSIANFITSELGSDTPWHISAFYPHYKMTYKNQTPAQAIQRAFDIGKASGLKYIYKGNVAEKGITYCPGCGEELIIRNGYFITKNVIQQGACPYCNTKINGIWN